MYALTTSPGLPVPTYIAGFSKFTSTALNCWNVNSTAITTILNSGDVIDCWY
ncbi:MAG: Uncharacterised protein [Methanobacteriota archaeon]|nr:MAG: Uncharacterised protein [Euryarchaeota archaeon]